MIAVSLCHSPFVDLALDEDSDKGLGHSPRRAAYGPDRKKTMERMERDGRSGSPKAKTFGSE